MGRDKNFFHMRCQHILVIMLCFLIMLMQTFWFSKKQSTVETETYGSEFLLCILVLNKPWTYDILFIILVCQFMVKVTFLEITRLLLIVSCNHMLSYINVTPCYLFIVFVKPLHIRYATYFILMAISILQIWYQNIGVTMISGQHCKH